MELGMMCDSMDDRRDFAVAAVEFPEGAIAGMGIGDRV